MSVEKIVASWMRKSSGFEHLLGSYIGFRKAAAGLRRAVEVATKAEGDAERPESGGRCEKVDGFATQAMVMQAIANSAKCEEPTSNRPQARSACHLVWGVEQLHRQSEQIPG